MNIFMDKLVLRAVEREDLDMIKELTNNSVTHQTTASSVPPVSSYQQERWFERISSDTTSLRLIIDVEEMGPVGLIGMTNIDYVNGVAEFSGLRLLPKACGKGLGTLATKALVAYAFSELRLECIYAQVLARHTASIRMCEKAGFVQEGILRSRWFRYGQRLDSVTMSVLLSDWMKER